MSRQQGATARGPDRAGRPQETFLVPLGFLKIVDTPRLVREDPAHAALLAEIEEPLPPITVHRPTMQVIDGVHRVRAAKLRGDRTIAVRFFDGDEEAAFITAIKANLTHGMPLSWQDRLAAAGRLLQHHPEWSDRVVAEIVGISPDALARLRSTVAVRQLDVRVGRDGRVRPVDPAPGRLRARAVFEARPEASLREVARAAGISVGTARDVRERLRRGEDPVPRGRRRAPEEQARATNAAARGEEAFTAALSILQTLTKDPTLRFTEDGRRLLRWLGRHALTQDDQTMLLDSVPPHCARPLAEFARTHAAIWHRLAEQIERAGQEFPVTLERIP